MTPREAQRVRVVDVKKVLVGKAGPLEGNAYTIAERTLIGRDGDCDIQVIDKGVSRKHVSVLAQADGTTLVRDMASHNGTYVRGLRVSETLIEPGDEIVIGESRFRFELIEADADQTNELDLKLVSGPAEASTVELELSQDQQDAITEAVALRKQLVTARTVAPSAPPPECCDSPLAAKAREEGWNFCPSCGAPLSH
jgi:pSer/pThr/pTyr-binding forkhead associated (FHA) protein